MGAAVGGRAGRNALTYAPMNNFKRNGMGWQCYGEEAVGRSTIGSTSAAIIRVCQWVTK